MLYENMTLFLSANSIYTIFLNLPNLGDPQWETWVFGLGEVKMEDLAVKNIYLKDPILPLLSWGTPSGELGVWVGELRKMVQNTGFTQKQGHILIKLIIINRNIYSCRKYSRTYCGQFQPNLT